MAIGGGWKKKPLLSSVHSFQSSLPYVLLPMQRTQVILCPRSSSAIWTVAVELKNGCREVLLPGVELKSLAVMSVIRNHQRKNERWEHLLFYTNYTVNLSDNIKYRHPNLKGNYVAQLIRKQGDGQALCFIFMG